MRIIVALTMQLVQTENSINYRNIKQWARDHHDARRHKVRRILSDSMEHFHMFCELYSVHTHLMHGNCSINNSF